MRVKYDFVGICRFNTNVCCDKKDKCLKCGWNPDVFDKRKKETRKKLKEAES